MNSGEYRQGEIVQIEGDDLQSQYWRNILQQGFPDRTIRQIPDERSFYNYMREQAAPTASRPAVVITEMMVRWNRDPEDNTPAPIPIEWDGFYRAGVRIIDRLALNPGTQDAPIVLLTTLDPKDIARELVTFREAGCNVTYQSKKIGRDRSVLPNLIRGLIGRNQ